MQPREEQWGKTKGEKATDMLGGPTWPGVGWSMLATEGLGANLYLGVGTDLKQRQQKPHTHNYLGMAKSISDRNEAWENLTNVEMS